MRGSKWVWGGSICEGVWGMRGSMCVRVWGTHNSICLLITNVIPCCWSGYTRFLEIPRYACVVCVCVNVRMCVYACHCVCFVCMFVHACTLGGNSCVYWEVCVCVTYTCILCVCVCVCVRVWDLSCI